MWGGMRLFRLFGIEVYLDWSIIIVFGLITASLGLGLIPTWHPELSPMVTIGMALVAAVLFILSVLIHEFSHALVGRTQGMTVRRITLFVFGGMAHLESEASTWKGEFWMTIVGPLTSLALGVGFLFLGGLLAKPGVLRAGNPEELMAALSPVDTLLLWLGTINILLALFNMIPGFPLDGGRVLRALLWGGTGSFYKATRWATWGGRAFAALLISAGVAMMLGVRLPLFGTGLISGLWLAFIGWFLHNAAVMTYRQLKMRRVLQDVPVSRLLRSGVIRVPASISVQELVDQYVLGHGDQRAWAVERDGRLVGLITLHDVRAVDRGARSRTSVAETMTPWDRLQTTTPEDDAGMAFEQLSKKGVGQLPVVKNGELVGLLRREELMHWIHWFEETSERRI